MPGQNPWWTAPAKPRHLILPRGIVSTGWPAVRDTCGQLGLGFDPWQQDLNRAILAKDAEGFYAAEIVVLSICRQAGKTYDIGGIVFADAIIHPGSTTVWTAHRFKVARETFEELKALASLPAMAPHIDVDAITTAAGNECIPFRNGSRIVFAARERGSVRGFTNVRRIVIDEAQILTEGGMSDLAPTLNHGFRPQAILMGTPPRPQDPGQVFSSLRADALSEGPDAGVLFVEFSADPDVDLTDWDSVWEAVAQANPSFPDRTTKRAIRRLRKLLGTNASFAREGLGIWDDAALGTLFDLERWGSPVLLNVPEQRPRPIALAFATERDRRMSYVALAGRRADGRVHLQLVRAEPGTTWLAGELADLKKRKPVDIVVDATDPAASLLPDIEKLRPRVKVRVVPRQEVARASGRLVDGVTDATVTHGGDPRLTPLIEVARKQKLGGSFVIADPLDESVDVAALRALSLALYALLSSNKTAAPDESSTRRATVM